VLVSFTMPDLVVDRNGAILLRAKIMAHDRGLMQGKSSDPNNLPVVTEAALMMRGVSQLYLSLSDPMQNGNVAARLCFKPHVLLI
jgi:cytochrome c biogenesis factor